MKRLWEIDHPYYCNEGNYYAPGNDQPHAHHRSWAEFISEEGNSDFDMNLVFRFDWKERDEDDEPTYNGDDYYRNGVLSVFYMGQRKGLYRWATVEVCRADEPAVLEFLRPRWEYLRQLWEGVSGWLDATHPAPCGEEG